MEKLRIAYIGISHPHVIALYKTMIPHKDEVEVIGFADIPADGLTKEERIAALGITMKGDIADGRLPEYADWRDLLEQKPDVAVVLADNRNCADICCAALSKGIAVVNEKPLTVSMEDAKRMEALSKEHNAPIITNWPIAWFPSFRKAKELADAGTVGKIMRVTYRSPATWGPFPYEKPNEEKARTWWFRGELGGGSVLDYACYGAILSTWIFGKRAKRVSAITKQFTTASYSDVEDYSAMMLDFGDGVGLLEGSWSTFNCGQVPTGPVIYGTEGTIVCDRYCNEVKVYKGVSHAPTEPTEVYTTEKEQQVELLGKNIIDFLRGRAPLNDMLALDINMDTMAALDAGIRSSKLGGFVDVEK